MKNRFLFFKTFDFWFIFTIFLVWGSFTAYDKYSLKPWADKRNASYQQKYELIDKVYKKIAGADQIIDDKEKIEFIRHFGFNYPIQVNESFSIIPDEYDDDGTSKTYEIGFGLKPDGSKSSYMVPAKIVGLISEDQLVAYLKDE